MQLAKVWKIFYFLNVNGCFNSSWDAAATTSTTSLWYRIEGGKPRCSKYPYTLGQGWQQVSESAWLRSQARPFKRRWWEPSRHFNTAMSKQRRQTALIRPVYLKQSSHAVEDATTLTQSPLLLQLVPLHEERNNFITVTLTKQALLL